jgi:hypothetical protein
VAPELLELEALDELLLELDEVLLELDELVELLEVDELLALELDELLDVDELLELALLLLDALSPPPDEELDVVVLVVELVVEALVELLAGPPPVELLAAPPPEELPELEPVLEELVAPVVVDVLYEPSTIVVPPPGSHAIGPAAPSVNDTSRKALSAFRIIVRLLRLVARDRSATLRDPSFEASPAE